MTLEDGTGIAGADSYADPEAAFTLGYVQGHLYASAWTAATLDQKTAACIQATRTLEAIFMWNGKRLTTVQTLSWPRYGFWVDGIEQRGLPDPVRAATVEMAIALLEKNRTSDTASGSQPLEALSLGGGALSLNFGEDPVNAPITARNMVPAFVAALLRNYGFRGGAGMARVERR